MPDKKSFRLTDNQAYRLKQIAEQTGMTQGRLIATVALGVKAQVDALIEQMERNAVTFGFSPPPSQDVRAAGEAPNIHGPEQPTDEGTPV